MFDDFPSMFGSKAHKIRGTWAPMIGSFYYSADIEEDDKDLSEFDSLKNSKSLASKALKKAMQDGLFDTVLKKDAILKRDAILSKINARNRAVGQERLDRELMVYGLQKIRTDPWQKLGLLA